MRSLRRLLALVQPLFVIVAFAILFRLLLDQRNSLAAYTWRVRPKWLIASSVFLIGAWLAEIRMWQRLLNLVGGRLEYWTAVRIWFSSTIVRYIPGSIWQPLSLTMLCSEQDVRPETTLASLPFFHVSQLIAIGPVAALYFATWGRGLFEWRQPISQWWVVVSAIPIVVFLIWPRSMLAVANFILARMGRQPLPLSLTVGQLTRVFGMSILTWLFFCAGFVTLVGAVAMLPSGSFWEAVLRLAAAYPIAYGIGFISVMTPSGLGVREGILFLLVNPVLGNDGALVVVLAMRLWEIGLEALISGSIIGGRWLARA